LRRNKHRKEANSDCVCGSRRISLPIRSPLRRHSQSIPGFGALLHADHRLPEMPCVTHKPPPSPRASGREPQRCRPPPRRESPARRRNIQMPPVWSRCLGSCARDRASKSLPQLPLEPSSRRITSWGPRLVLRRLDGTDRDFGSWGRRVDPHPSLPGVRGTSAKSNSRGRQPSLAASARGKTPGPASISAREAHRALGKGGLAADRIP
jgi:hypothetical protein